jgi:hypothetical protein
MTAWSRRTWGCRVSGCQIEGMEAVILENTVLRVVVLAGKGAEIIELTCKPKDVNVLWRAPNGVVNPRRTITSVSREEGSFMDSYGGGWQELFPTLGLPARYYGAAMGEHGEVALLDWDVHVEHDEPERASVSFSVRCLRSPFRLVRTMTLEGAERPVLDICEQATNEGGEPLRFMWGHHPVLGPPFLEPGCKVNVRSGSVQATSGPGGSFSARGPATPWPWYVNAHGEKVDLSIVAHQGPGQVDELYLTDLETGEYEVRNDRLGVCFALRWDLQVFPYLWWWRGLGAQPGYPWYNRAYMLGLELFSSVPPDFAGAERAGTTLSLGPGETMACSLEAHLYCLSLGGSRGREGQGGEEKPVARQP